MNIGKKEWWLSSGEAEAPFLLTNGVFGDGSNDYLQVRESGGSAYSFTTTSDWTFELWVKVPTTVTANEGIYSSNPTNTANNLFNINLVSVTGSSPARYGFQVDMYTSAGANILTSFINARYIQNSATKKNYHLIIRCDYNGSTYDYHAFCNGYKSTLSTGEASKPTSLGFNFLTDRNVAGRYSDANIYGARLYNSALSDAQCTASYNNGNWSEPLGTQLFDFRFNSRSGNDFAEYSNNGLKVTAVNFTDVSLNLSTPAKVSTFRRLIFSGNSLMLGQGGATNSTPPYNTYGLLNDAIYENFFVTAVSGRTTTQVISNFSTVDEIYRDTSNTTDIYIPWEITNEIAYGTSATDGYNNYVTLCGLARAAGYKVVAMTVLPRSNAGIDADFATKRATVNSNIVANWATFADALADVAANTTIGDDGDELNTTYYNADKVHMTNAGYDIVSGIIKDAILTI